MRNEEKIITAAKIQNRAAFPLKVGECCVHRYAISPKCRFSRVIKIRHCALLGFTENPHSSPYNDFSISNHKPHWSGRIAARASVGGELPIRTLSVVRRVHSSPLDHVSAKPPSHPGRSVFPSLGWRHRHFPHNPSYTTRNLSVRPHTSLDCIV